MKELTKAEEQIMQILWEMEEGFVNDIVDRMPEPKPAYNTVSTIVRILEKKGFVDHKAFGKTHQYFPLIQKKDYTRSYMKSFIGSYFGNSFKEMVSFFVRDRKISKKELEDLINIIEGCASSDIYSILKREDEKFVTEKAFANPKFVEDVVRDIAETLKKDQNFTWFAIEAENFESIHNHSAYAYLERKNRGGKL